MKLTNSKVITIVLEVKPKIQADLPPNEAIDLLAKDISFELQEVLREQHNIHMNIDTVNVWEIKAKIVVKAWCLQENEEEESA